MHIERIDRLGILVRSLDQGKDFFSRVFDIEFDNDVVYENWSIKEGTIPYKVRLAYEPLGFELATPQTPDSFLMRGLERRGEGFFGMALKVPDIEAGVKELVAKGLTVTGRVEVGDMIEVGFHPRDTLGVLFALVSYPGKHPASVAALKKQGLVSRGVGPQAGGKPVKEKKVRIEKIDHIGIIVRDMKKAREFFARVFDQEFDDEFVYDNLKVRIAHNHLGFELAAAESPDSFLARSLEKRGEGVFAVALKVPDIEEGVRELKTRGMVESGRVHVGDMIEVSFYPRDTLGVMFALVWYPDVHPATVAALRL